MILYIVTGAILALLVLIGFLVGFFKGFVNVQTWAAEYIVSALLTISISAILNKLGVSTIVAGAITIICAVALLLGFIGLFKLFKKLFNKSFERCDDNLQNYGVVGVLNRIFGGIVLAIKAVTIFLIIVVPVFIVLDFANISALQSILNPVYNSAFWYALKPIAFDMIIIGIMNIAIRHGFSNGVLTSLWALLVFAFIVGAGFLAYHLAFRSGLFDGASAALSAKVSGWFGDIQFLKNISELIAKIIITVGLFLLLLIVVIVVSFFTSRVISFARLSDGFYIVDGVLGAIVLLLITVAVMLFLGYLIQPLYGMEFMKPFDGYFRSGAVANYFYGNNLLIEAGAPVLIPIRDWLS